MTNHEPARPRWSVVVPVKAPARAKSRLHPLADATREALALAFAADAVAAALRSPLVARVLVVTTDAAAARDRAGLGAVPVEDRPDEGIDAAVLEGARVARATGSLPVAAMAGDLPALRTEDLTAALLLAATHPAAVVADAAGTGTTLLTARDGWLTPHFGVGSAAAHVEAGAVLLGPDTLPVPSLRRDVDTPADLAAAVHLGTGPRTTALLAALDEDLADAAGAGS
ncbi:MAG: 2-phospho-L-lactate guanylyltransferase [Motilibacteraceae bacterium]